MKSYLWILPFFLFISFQKKKGTGCDHARLCEKAAFPVGVAVNVQKLKTDEAYRNIIISQFNSLTAEKSMKAVFIHPEKGKYDFSETDYLIDFCKEHNKRLHGHTLVWYKNNPAWMEKFKGDKTAWELMLKDHIQMVMNHCKGFVKSWDVVNEAFNDDGSLRNNIWLKNIGESYIEKSFRYAHEADPSALLFYNDYDLESKPEKLAAVLKFFEGLRAKGVKVDGLGMQMHVSVTYPYVTDINLAAMKVDAHNFLIHYSEADISLLRSDKLFTMNNYMLKLQKSRMKEIVAGYMKIKKQNRFGITMWGVSDADSWLSKPRKKDQPLLFDSGYNAKPAYCGFLEGLLE